MVEKISIDKLFTIIPDLVNLFLSGYIFMSTFSWIRSKKYENNIVVIWSLFISILIHSVCSSIHMIVFSNIIFDIYKKMLIYSTIGFLCAIICCYILKNKHVNNLLYKIHNKSIYDDILDDMIDYDKGIYLRLYMKGNNFYYLGRFLYREENGINSRIALVDYGMYSTNNDDEIFNDSNYKKPSCAIINLQDVESMHLIYEDNTDIWTKFEK